jgi:hypothetical protein
MDDAASRTRWWKCKTAAFMSLAFVLSIGIVFWLIYGSEVIARTQLPLIVEPQELNLGCVWEDKSFPWTITLRNPTSGDVEIVSIAASCSCVSVQPQSLTVPARKSARVQLTFDLTRRKPRERDAPVRDVDVTVVPIIRNRPVQRLGWTIRGQVRRAITFQPQSLEFGETLVRGYDFPSTTVTLAAHTSLTDLAAICDPPCGAARLSKSSCAAHEAIELTVHPNKDLPTGRATFQVILRSRAVDARKIPDVFLPVGATVVEDIQAIPARIPLGARPIGAIIEESIVISSRHGEVFTVEHIDFPGSTTAIAPQPSRDHGLVFTLTHRVSRPGFNTDIVTFAVKKPASPLLEVPIHLSYFGTNDLRADER